MLGIFLDLNKMEQRPQKQMIVFKPINQMLSDGDTSSEQPSLKTQPIGDSPVLVPDWFDHPLGNLCFIQQLYLSRIAEVILALIH